LNGVFAFTVCVANSIGIVLVRETVLGPWLGQNRTNVCGGVGLT